MVNINGPFLIALIVIIFLAAIKWMEWYLFRSDTDSPCSSMSAIESRATNKVVSRFGSAGYKLKGLLFFGKADLRIPWYGRIPMLLLFIIINGLHNTAYQLQLWQIYLYLMLAIVIMVWFEVFVILHSNKDFFTGGDRKRRYLRTQTAQCILALLLTSVFLTGLQLSHSHQQLDPPGLRESVDWVIEPVYDDAGNFREGLAAVEKDGKWGYINKDGNPVIPFLYEKASEFDGGLAPVQMNGNWMVIDRKSDVRFETDFEYIFPFREGVSHVEVRDKQYRSETNSNLIDTQGNLIFKGKYDFIGSFSEGCIPVFDLETGLGYFLDRNERKVIPLEFLDAGSFRGGYAPVWLLEGGYALIDHNGHVVQSIEEASFYQYKGLCEGLVLFTVGEWGKRTLHFGFKDLYDNIMIPAEFQAVGNPGEGLIAIQVDGLWGFIENPLPKAARGTEPEYWVIDKTQIGIVEGLPVYAGALEIRAHDVMRENPELARTEAYRKAFEQIKIEKSHEKHGKTLKPDEIRYQIGDTYYKKLLLESSWFQRNVGRSDRLSTG